MQVYCFSFNPFEQNTYVVDFNNRHCAIIDCGAYSPQEQTYLAAFLTSHQLTPIAHLLTHGHLDHCFGANFLFEKYGIIPYIHPNDVNLYLHLQQQCQVFGITPPHATLEKYQALRLLETNIPSIFSITNENVPYELRDWCVLPTPGHTPGGVCFLTKTDNQQVLFSGDTLFKGTVGRTDLQGGNSIVLSNSLQIINTLSNDVIIYPGHGENTTLKYEKQHNFYLLHL